MPFRKYILCIFFPRFESSWNAAIYSHSLDWYIVKVAWQRRKQLQPYFYVVVAAVVAAAAVFGIRDSPRRPPPPATD